MTYIFCFIITTIIAYFAQRKLDSKNKKLGIFLLILVILIPSIIAGVRSLNVGRDINLYVEQTIYNSKHMSFFPYMFKYDLEIGYKLLIYLTTIINPNTNLALFTSQLIIMIFIVLFAYKNKNNSNIALTILIYLLTFYCYTFTFMRQSIAVAIILYSTLFFKEKKYLKTLLLFLLAFSFHKTALLSIPMYLIIFIFENENINSKKKTSFFILIIFSLLISVIFFNEIIYFLTKILNILPTRYYDYTQNYLHKEINIPWIASGYEIFWLFLAIFYKVFSKDKNTKINIDVTILFFIISLISVILSYKIVNLDRIRFYFFYPAIFSLIPNIKFAFKDEKNIRKLITILIISFIFSYWCWLFPVVKWSEEYPYSSDIIPFLK